MEDRQRRRRVDQVIFVAAALYNFINAGIPLIAPDFHFHYFFTPKAVEASRGTILYFNTNSLWFSILLFGFGYLWAARIPERNRSVLWLGSVGKIYCFIIWSAGYFAGTTTIIAFLGGVGDLIFAILFLRFLLRDQDFVPVVRTPDERFSDLPDFPFAPKYLDINGVRVHYLDEGQGDIILCLHGEPSWSFLYRKMIPLLIRRYRVIAPDFIGFGRSDKFTRQSDYSFALHRDTLEELIRRLGISSAVLVAHDWGGMVGMRVLSRQPDLFTHVVIFNTDLPTGEETPSFWERVWLLWIKLDLFLPIGRTVRLGMIRRLPTEVVRGYQAPFPTDEFKQGAWQWPFQYPRTPSSPVAQEMRETRRALSQWSKPAAVIFSDRDPINGHRYQFFRDLIPTANGPQSTLVKGVGHFLFEIRGEVIANRILDFLAQTSTRTQVD